VRIGPAPSRFIAATASTASPPTELGVCPGQRGLQRRRETHAGLSEDRFEVVERESELGSHVSCML